MGVITCLICICLRVINLIHWCRYRYVFFWEEMESIQRDRYSWLRHFMQMIGVFGRSGLNADIQMHWYNDGRIIENKTCRRIFHPPGFYVYIYKRVLYTSMSWRTFRLLTRFSFTSLFPDSLMMSGKYSDIHARRRYTACSLIPFNASVYLYLFCCMRVPPWLFFSLSLSVERGRGFRSYSLTFDASSVSILPPYSFLLFILKREKKYSLAAGTVWQRRRDAELQVFTPGSAGSHTCGNRWIRNW